MTLAESQTDAVAIRSKAWKPEFDESRAWRTRLGFVLISNDSVIEEDMQRMAPDGVGVHFTRAPMPTGCTVENLASMKDGLAAAAAELLPEFPLSVVCYACTSGSAVIGEEQIMAELKRACPDRQATTLITGVIEGLRAIGAKRIVLGTPYLDEVNAIEAQYMEAKGFELLDVQGMSLKFDSDITRVTPRYIAKFAQAIDQPEADAIFISCGALRAIDVISEIEAEIGKPVITSNQSMLWHCLRLAGIEERIEGYGRLFREH